MPGVSSIMPVDLERLQSRHQRMDTQPKLEIEYQRAVFDQQIVVAGPAIDDARPTGRFRQLGEDRILDADLAGRACQDGAERRDHGFLRRLGRHGGGRRDALEAHAVTGPELAQLPEIGLDDGGRADEAAERWTVGPQDHGHVAGEIDGAHGIGIVVDVRGV